MLGWTLVEVGAGRRMVVREEMNGSRVGYEVGEGGVGWVSCQYHCLLEVSQKQASCFAADRTPTEAEA